MMRDHRKHDVVIIGAGPVGLLLSVCLSRWGYDVRHIDNRPVPTATGRADGLQPRTLEILENLGLMRNIMAYDPAKVFEVAFWDPAPGGKIVRTGTWASCPKFLDSRYPFTALLHQGLIERVMIDDLAKNGTKIDRPWTITRFENNGKDPEYPVEVDIKSLDSNVTETVKTKYLFSGEGARSFVREELKVQIRHKDPISHVWGVMDGVVRTNFPDIKLKCTIHSDHGSIMVIPREANMVRLYIQIASSTDPDFNPRKSATVEEVQAAAKRIFQPYYVEWDTVDWYSVYPIGQGLADKYTLDNRVFMGGDACHTHSPKAGQGMNTAFHDAINMAWKLHYVESGFADRSILETYELERRDIAERLLDFDNKYAALFSKRQPSASEVSSAHQEGETKNEFIETFKESCEFTSGYGVMYKPNIFNYSPETHSSLKSTLFSPKGNKLTSGRIMPPSTVTRVVDANVVHLENEIPFNGSFRFFIFAGLGVTTDNKSSLMPLINLAANLERADSFYMRFSSKYLREDSHHESDNPHSRFFSVALVIADQRPKVEIGDLPQFYRDYSDHVYADDIWDARVPDAKAAAHAKVGLENGGIVVLRPDGHVGCVVALTDGPGTVQAMEEYFSGFTSKAGTVLKEKGGCSRNPKVMEVRAQL